jgi:hypothetical protein
MSDSESPPINPKLARVLGMVHFVLTPFAGPYRVVLFKPFTPGFADFLLTWAGVIFVYPLLVTSPHGWLGKLIYWGGWLGLGALARYRFKNSTARSEAGVSDGVLKHWEPAAALAMCLGASSVFGLSLIAFLLVGYAACASQAGIVLLQERGITFSEEDFQRAKAALMASSRPVKLAASTGKGLFSRLFRLIGWTVFPYVMIFLRCLGFFSSGGKADGKEHRPPTFTNRVICQTIAVLLASFIKGGISLSMIFNGFVYVQTVILTAMGYHVIDPNEAEDKPKSLVVKASEAVEHAKEKVEKIDDRLKHGRRH